MAKRATMKEAPPPSDSGIHSGDFQRDIGEINRQKGHASEYSGAAGKLTREAIDKHHLERSAFAFIMRVSKMDPVKRHDAIRSVFTQIEAAGFLDQVDAFSDLVDELQGIVTRMKSRTPNARHPDETLSTLVN